MTENIEKDVIKALELALKFADEPIGENWTCSITTKAAKEILNLIKNKNTELKELKAEIERYEKTVGKLVTNDDGTAFATLDGQKTEYIQKKVATILKNIAVKKAKSEARKEFGRDNVICCDDNCQRCANLIYNKYMEQKAEIERLKGDLAFCEKQLDNLAKEIDKLLEEMVGK